MLDDSLILYLQVLELLKPNRMWFQAYLLNGTASPTKLSDRRDAWETQLIVITPQTARLRYAINHKLPVFDGRFGPRFYEIWHIQIPSKILTVQKLSSASFRAAKSVLQISPNCSSLDFTLVRERHKVLGTWYEVSLSSVTEIEGLKEPQPLGHVHMT